SVQQIVRNSTFNLAGQATHVMLSFLVVVVLAHGLDKEAFGRYFTFFSVIMVVQLALEAGTSMMLTRRIARSPENWRRTVAEATGVFSMIILGSITVFLAAGCVWTGCRPDPETWGCFVAAGLACALMHVEQFCC